MTGIVIAFWFGVMVAAVWPTKEERRQFLNGRHSSGAQQPNNNNGATR